MYYDYLQLNSNKNQSNITLGAVHKWYHPLRREGGFAKSWNYKPRSWICQSPLDPKPVINPMEFGIFGLWSCHFKTIFCPIICPLPNLTKPLNTSAQNDRYSLPCNIPGVDVAFATSWIKMLRGLLLIKLRVLFELPITISS